MSNNNKDKDSSPNILLIAAPMHGWALDVLECAAIGPNGAEILEVDQ